MAEPVNTLVAHPDEVYEELDIRPVKVPKAPNWNILDLIERAPGDNDNDKAKWLFDNVWSIMPRSELAALRNKWPFWARPNQLAPAGSWTFWLLLAGRGFGKTRTGAEWINERVQSGKARRIALVAPTAADVRKVMVEGESGILAISPPWNRPVFESSKLQLTWPNGAIAQMFSAEEPERLRGPQCDTFWADEIAAWRKLQETWDMLQFGFRLGTDPRGCITTTPKPLPILRELVADDRAKVKDGQTALTRGSTYENRANLAPKFFSQIVTKYEGTRLGRQELEAEILDDMPGALWQRTSIDKNRIGGVMPFPAILKPVEPGALPGADADFIDLAELKVAAANIVAKVPEDLTRLVVAIDPNASNDEGSDEIGITVCGKGVSGRGYLLADCSCKGSPHEWASVAILAHDAFNADRIIAEANNGGNMVEHTVTSTAKALKLENKRKSDHVGITLVHASRGKVTRAEPVSSLYEQNRITHVGTMKVIEDQMCLFTSDFDRKAMGYSPDRVDSLVWGFTHLFHEQQDGAGIFDFMRQEVEKMRSVQAGVPQQGEEDWITFQVTPGISTVYGREGHAYPVRKGLIRVRPSDEPSCRASGFVAVPGNSTAAP